MVGLTQNQTLNLQSRGIYTCYHDYTLPTKVRNWFESKGEEFLLGKKELLLFGNSNCSIIDIGYAIQRWFILDNGEGLVTNLLELANSLANTSEIDQSFRELIHTSKSIFVSGVQEPGPCPLTTRETYLVAEFFYRRHLDPNFGQTVIHASDTDFQWYSKTFQNFIQDTFLVLDEEVIGE